MEKLTDLPKSVRYDFFMATFGMLTAYFVYTNENVYQTFVLRVLLIILACVCLLYGVYEMKLNYDNEIDLKLQERVYAKQRILLDLLRVEQEMRIIRKQQYL